MKADKVLTRTLLMIILCLCVWANLECVLAQSTNVSKGSWVWNDGNLTGRGAGWAGYNGSCGEGVLNLSFKLKELDGTMLVNININGIDRYAIGFVGHKQGEMAFSIDTYIFKQVGERAEPRELGITKSSGLNREYQVTIISKGGHILLYIEEVGHPRFASKPLIDYNDPDPLPLGGVDFETLEGAYVKIYDIVLTCPPPLPPNRPPNVTSLMQDLPRLRVGLDVDWTADAYDPEEDDIKYSFWLRGPTTKDVWELQQDWGASDRWGWRPSQRGYYRIGVYANDSVHSAEDIINSNDSWRDELVYVYGEPLPLGIAYFKRPDPDGILINGTPPDQVLIVVNKSYSFEDAELLFAGPLAKRLNGSIVGKLQCINMFQIETNGTTLEELLRDVDIANNYSDDVLAFPNRPVIRESASDEPVYEDATVYGGKCGGYDMICVQEAWDTINKSDVKLYPVTVGVIDDGIYRWGGPSSEFDNATLNMSVGGWVFAPANLGQCLPGFETAGSHGTGVMNILAADPGDGGLVGIASKALGDNLEVKLINIFPDDKSFSTDAFLALTYMLENGSEYGSTIISCSWGNDEADMSLARTYKKFFEYPMENERDDILFICSAGNGGNKYAGGISSTIHAPGGVILDNTITVGNILNNWIKADGSNMKSSKFEVTLAAPGEEAVWGRNSSGNIINYGGGTSMATPHVTAAAAIIRSINPNKNASQIKHILTSTGRPCGLELGGKVLNLSEAVNYAKDNLPEIVTNKGKPALNKPPSGADGTVGRDTPPKNWILKITLPDLTGNLEGTLKLTQHDIVITGEGNLSFTPRERSSEFTSSKSECPEDHSTDYLEEFLADAPQTSSRRPVKANGSFEGTNLNLSMISLNDNVRYQLTLSVTGSSIRGRCTSYDNMGNPHSGICYGSLERNDPTSMAASDSQK